MIHNTKDDGIGDRNIRKLCSISVFFILMATGCGEEGHSVSAFSARPVEMAIINGEKCTENDFPSSLEIIVDATIDFGPFGEFHLLSQICGGTLIAPDVVLTAAHCLDPESLTSGMGRLVRVSYSVVPDADLTSLDDSENPSMPANATLAKSWVIHEDYNTDAFGGEGLGQHRDIGLLFLSKPLSIKPTMVISREEAKSLVKDAEVSIVGWGQQVAEESEGPEIEANATEEAPHGVKMCAKSNINELGEFEMQIGSDPESKRKCYGDSGGATYAEILTSSGVETRLIGITSHAYDQSACFKGGVDTRVDAYLDWIDAKMTEACQSKTRTWCEVEGVIKPQAAAQPQPLLLRIWAYLLSWIYWT